MSGTLWILEAIGNEKFPYRLRIVQNGRILLCLWVQERWPGQKGNVFCIRDENEVEDYPAAEIERVPVISLERFGKKLAVILDRAINKRCDFLFLSKQYKSREGFYEQIFWRTERGLKERKPKVKLSTYNKEALNIVVDSAERYAWRFPGDTVLREKLPVGDYALKEKNKILAVIERKTFDNLLHEFGKMSAFHQQLSELGAYRHCALVIEANYSDFLNPTKMKHYPPAFAAKALAELHALHPELTIVYTGNRKLAQEWSRQFLSAVTAHEHDVPHQKISEIIKQYGTPPKTTGGCYFEMKQAISHDFPQEFTAAAVRNTFPDAPESTVHRALRDLKSEGLIEAVGRGKKSYWIKKPR